MHNLLKTLEKGIVCLTLITFSGACIAADNTTARGAAQNNRGRTTGVSRMPSIPVLPVNAVGNMSVGKDNINPTPVNPDPVNPDPVNPDPVNPDPVNPDPDTPVNPTPTPECPDGGVANSDYTVETCMNDIFACVNSGSLPNGINSLFNEDLRNSIVNGMGLCLTQVERCVTTVRKNCQYVYASSSDVWLDFNARKVQPEYYAFVLRQTGLTPTQAENTCLLLDRNTYGLSFDAVSDVNITTSEYNQKVGAYNGANNNGEIKANPMGVQVNSTGIDGNRGYYARWDAENAQCLLRVAAYNKDTLITNSWLFGIVGDDRNAEVWQHAGSTFTCNKDLFDFSLMPTTKTVAATAIPGGTLLGAGIGALAGHGDKRFDCKDASMRDKLLHDLQDSGKIGALNLYLRKETQLSSTSKSMSNAQCQEIVELYDLWKQGETEIQNCNLTTYSEMQRRIKFTCSGDPKQCADLTEKIKETIDDLNCQECNSVEALKCYFLSLNLSQRDGTGVHCTGTGNICLTAEEFRQDLDKLAGIFNAIDLLEGEKSNRLKTTLIGAGTGAAVGGTATAITAFVERNNINCRVADGLARVSYNKSYTIDRLRDFYVKWALNLPQTLAPTAVVTNCDNWQLTCAMFTDLKECAAAQFNYRPGNLSSTTLVQNPCRTSGSACIANLGVAQSYGACVTTPDNQDTPTADYPQVKTCNEWKDACQVYNNNTAECNKTKVIYTPASMLVSTACKYNSSIKECRPNSAKVNQYMAPMSCNFETR